MASPPPACTRGRIWALWEGDIMVDMAMSLCMGKCLPEGARSPGGMVLDILDWSLRRLGTWSVSRLTIAGHVNQAWQKH